MIWVKTNYLLPICLSTVPHQYLLDLSISPNNKKLNREGDITRLLEVIFPRSCLTEIYASRESFGFTRDVTGSTRRCTIYDKFVVIVLKIIMTPLFVSFDRLHVWLVHNNDDCLGYQLSPMMPFMPMRLYRRHDMSSNALSPYFVKMIKKVYLT